MAAKVRSSLLEERWLPSPLQRQTGKGSEINPKGTGPGLHLFAYKISSRPRPLSSSPSQLRSVFIHTTGHSKRAWARVLVATPSFSPFFPHTTSHSETKTINYYCTIHNRHITRGNMKCLRWLSLLW